MIVFEDFSKVYKKNIAVQNISFTAEAGVPTVLLGANGAGKTTLLRACASLHYASSGKVFVDGIDAAENPAAVKKLVGYVPENPILYEDMTVAEFISASAELHGTEKNNLATAVLQTMSRCKLSEVAEKKIKTLSKGYRQRASLAAALVFDPPNIVLDEPASGLDPTQINQLRSLITELAKNKTVILSTHLISEAVAIEPHIVIISDKKIAASGTAEEICSMAKVSALEDAYIYFTGTQHEESDAEI